LLRNVSRDALSAPREADQETGRLAPAPAPGTVMWSENHSAARSPAGGGFGGYPVTVYWIVAANAVPGVVPAGTATTIWLVASVHVPSLVADAVASVIGVE
jgi:hypothetical protein